MTIPDSGYMMENGSINLPCTPEEEKRIIMDLTYTAESNLKEGNLYYVISTRWSTHWQEYTGQEVGACLFDRHSIEPSLLPKTVDRPGLIDNTVIVANGSDCRGDDLELRRTLEEGRHYVLVPQEAWEKFCEWYKGGPALPRKMISLGDSKKMSVEVYPLTLRLIDSRDQSQLILRISKKASLHELYQRVCAFKGIELKKACIWDFFNKRKHTILVDSSQTLEDSNLVMDHNILLEMDRSHCSGGMDSKGNELALVPIEPMRSSKTVAGGPTLSNGYSTAHSSSLYQGGMLGSALTDMEDRFDTSRPVAKGGSVGLAGLQNLGNTCFVNSAVQCLVHTPPLVEYFWQDYSGEINRQNPLGLHVLNCEA